ALEEEGIVSRATFPAVPPRVEYSLTEKGLALIPIIDDMREYGERWLGAQCATAPAAEGGQTGETHRAAAGGRGDAGGAGRGLSRDRRPVGRCSPAADARPGATPALPVGSLRRC